MEPDNPERVADEGDSPMDIALERSEREQEYREWLADNEWRDEG